MIGGDTSSKAEAQTPPRAPAKKFNIASLARHLMDQKRQEEKKALDQR